MAGRREISLVESDRDNMLPGGAVRRRRRGGIGVTTIMVGTILLVCCLIVGYNVLRFEQRKKVTKAESRRGHGGKHEHERERESGSSDDVGGSSNADDDERPVHKKTKKPHRGHHRQKMKLPDGAGLHDSSSSSSSDHAATSPPSAKPAVDTEGSENDGSADDGGHSSGSEYASLEDRIHHTIGRRICDPSAAKPGPDESRACSNPPAPTDWLDLKVKTGCDIFSVPFRPEDDERCLKLIGDSRNWATITPMRQRYDERTLKFKVTFAEDERLSAIVKVPQKLFPVEAMSEVGSFHADRVLETNRIPPTHWAHLPVKRVRKVLDEFAADQKLIDIFAHESKVSTYREWVEKDLIKYNYDQGWVVKDAEEFPGEDVLGVSVQLYIADVRPLLSSDLLIPWVAHNDSWQQHLTPSKPYPKKYAVSFIRQSELAMYDFVVGNGDRSPNKNNFVVGACRHHKTVSKCHQNSMPLHPGPPSFVTLDNGMMFFYELKPNRSPDGPNPLLKSSFCLFEKKLLKRLQKFGEHGFSNAMQKSLPGYLKEHLTKTHLRRCDKRLKKLLEQFESCSEKFGEDKVIVA
eukprot:Rhum_TRINITY_DN15185_c2_g1::Rhum_TRINITY_DN15185_c2_g1_i1::g.142838::m.142838